MSATGTKKKGLTKKAMHVGPNMTPMVDIVMCILIFFMLGSKFIPTELFLTSNMVVSDKGLATEASKKTDIPSLKIALELNMRGDTTMVVPKMAGSSRLNWEMPVGRPDRPDADIEHNPNDEAKQAALKAWVADQKSINLALVQKLKEVGADLKDDVVIVLKPFDFVPYSDVIKVYDACAAAGFKKVAFSPATFKTGRN